jgi:hypothetical protein
MGRQFRLGARLVHGAAVLVIKAFARQSGSDRRPGDGTGNVAR